MSRHGFTLIDPWSDHDRSMDSTRSIHGFNQVVPWIDLDRSMAPRGARA